MRTKVKFATTWRSVVAFAAAFAAAPKEEFQEGLLYLATHSMGGRAIGFAPGADRDPRHTVEDPCFNGAWEGFSPDQVDWVLFQSASSGGEVLFARGDVNCIVVREDGTEEAEEWDGLYLGPHREEREFESAYLPVALHDADSVRVDIVRAEALRPEEYAVVGQKHRAEKLRQLLG